MRVRSLSPVLFVALVWPVAGCGDSPAGPDGVPAISSLDITGPATLAPGETRPFRAMARLSDGSTRDVTAETAWSSSAGSVVSVAGSGLATGQGNGEAQILGNYRSRVDSTQVIVVPAGTYRLMGSVVDPLFPNLPVSNVTVEAIGADGVPHTAAVTRGGFRFYGLAGRVRLRSDSARSWLDPLDTSIDINDHLSVTLQWPTKDPGIDVSGQYRLTITADAACKGELPADGFVRSYQAQVSQRLTLVDVRLTGATFATSSGGMMMHNLLDGLAENGRLRLFLYEWTDSDPPYPGLYEVLSPGRYYGASGSSNLEETASGFAGRLDGTVVVAGAEGAGSCRASGHVLALSRENSAAASGR